MPAKKTTKEFISEAQKIFGAKYDYSKVVYKNSRDKVIIICPKHGEFLKAPQKHLTGQGCRVCSGYIKLDQKSFESRAKETHGDKYNYTKSVVKEKNDKVVIICKLHGEFRQLPGNHISGQGCPECGKLSRGASQRYSLKQFLFSVKRVHGNKYDYSKVKYFNSQTKIEVICPTHGSFMMKANSHANGQGCSVCGRIEANKNIALTYSEFLGRAAKTHGSRYIYDENSYKDFTTKMRIECSEHGWFKQKPHSHISMRTGCPKCGILQAAKSNEKGWGSVLNMFKEVHDDRYSYDESTYTDVSSKMKIKCYVHGWFSQKPYQHYSGSGCNKCAIIEVHEKQKIDFKEFKNRSQLKHGSRYNYSEGEYIDIFTPVKISCDKHGVFYQKPRDHYRGSGCPKCQSSRGENSVRLILQRLGIKFKEQKTFEGLKYRSKLKCDFYIPSSKTVIEYNGLQHYEPISVFGGLKGLQETQKRDVIKYDYLARNNIKLIIVRYDKDDIELYLKEKLNVANNG
jgi:hypothetical protein